MEITPNILLVQFRASPETIENEQRAVRRSIGNCGNVRTLSFFEAATAEELRDACLGADGVIFGGSGDFDIDGGRSPADPARATSAEILSKVRLAVDAIIASDKPFLGICYGHQLVAHIQGGCICNNKDQSKIGTHGVELTFDGRNDPLFAELPQRFDAQYGHKDSICALPDGATLLASSDKCNGAALRYGCNVYTTQFHPELTMDDVRFRMTNTSGYLPEGTSVEEIARPSPDADKIIPRWCELIVHPNRIACE